MENLDSTINRISFEIATSISQKKDKYFAIDNALGVLSSDGVYAYYVYCKAKGIDLTYIDELSKLTKYIKTGKSEGEIEVKLDEDYFAKLSENIEDLLFFKEMAEKVLVYARYHLKAMGN